MSNTKKFVVSENSILGRHLAAVGSVRAGEMILTEKPVIVGPKWGCKPCCLNCYRKSVKMCNACKIAPLCQGCEQHEASECELYKIVKWDPEFILQNFDVVTPVRVLLLSNTDQELFEEIMKMEARLNARRNTNIWKLHEKYVVLPILNSKLNTLLPNIEKLDIELIQKVCSILDLNVIEVRGGRDLVPDKAGHDPSFILRGLYRHPSLLVHNCLANSFLSVDADFNVRLYAGQDIHQGDIIMYNYAQVLLGTKERRSQLEKLKIFICNCKRCMDPKELGTYIGSIKCLECQEGLSSFTEGTSWMCEKCDKISDPKKVEDLIKEAKSSLASLNEDSFEIQTWIDNYSNLLNPRHWIVLDAKQILAGVLKRETGNGKGAPMKLLKKKLELYEEIIPIIKTLRPGLSKMLGIALYESQFSFIQIAQRMHSTGNITEEALLIDLTRAETLLKDAITNLVFEHKTTPEGQLCKRALVHLKELRVSIDNIRSSILKKQAAIKSIPVKQPPKKSKNRK